MKNSRRRTDGLQYANVRWNAFLQFKICSVLSKREMALLLLFLTFQIGSCISNANLMNGTGAMKMKHKESIVTTTIPVVYVSFGVIPLYLKVRFLLSKLK